MPYESTTWGFLPNPQKGIVQGVERAVLGDWDLHQCLNDRWHVNGFRLPGELVASTEIHVLPGNRRHLREEGRAVLVALVFFVGG